MKIEKVTRRAQEQFQMVLEEQSRLTHVINFSLFLSFLCSFIWLFNPCTHQSFELAFLINCFYVILFISSYILNLT
jgi:hypothetical protein